MFFDVVVEYHTRVGPQKSQLRSFTVHAPESDVSPEDHKPSTIGILPRS